MSEESGGIVTADPQGWWPRNSLALEGLVQKPLCTKRLRLRPLNASDADDVWQYQQDTEILRYIPWPERTREEAREHTERRAAAGATGSALRNDGDHLFLAVELATGAMAGRVIGDVMLRISSTVRAEVEVGWVFARDQQGHGYASEAAAEAVRLAFELLDAHRVVAHLDERNAASASLCARLGMRHEGTSYEQEWDPEGWINLELHSIDHEEWLALGSGLPMPREPSPVPKPPTVSSEGAPLQLTLPHDFVAQGAVPLHSDRLTIRAYREADGVALWSLVSDPEVMRFLPRGPTSLAEARFTAEHNGRATTLAHDGDVVKLVVEHHGRFAGQVKLELASVEDRVIEIGWTLATEFQGQGLATEAATALIKLAVRSIGAHRVIAYVNPQNHASAALATRLGLRPERLSRSDWRGADGTWNDTAVYAITAAEWRAGVS